MADFSKQWCDANDPEMPHDFDILEVFGKLKDGMYESWVCEGYGFGAIANIDGECLLHMLNGKWSSYDEVIK
jgi:hypothetical protein